jgi:uncharacterized protein YjcR
MNFLNGIEEKKQAYQPCFNIDLPEPVDEMLLSEIDNRIERMYQNYNQFIRRNRLLSVIAILETEVNEIENEINRL